MLLLGVLVTIQKVIFRVIKKMIQPVLVFKMVSLKKKLCFKDLILTVCLKIKDGHVFPFAVRRPSLGNVETCALSPMAENATGTNDKNNNGDDESDALSDTGTYTIDKETTEVKHARNAISKVFGLPDENKDENIIQVGIFNCELNFTSCSQEFRTETLLVPLIYRGTPMRIVGLPNGQAAWCPLMVTRLHPLQQVL